MLIGICGKKQKNKNCNKVKNWGLNLMDENIGTKSELIIYQTEDGKIRLDVRIEDETVWLTQAQMVQLFQSSKSNISEHIKHIFEEGELEENSVVREFRTTASDGKSYQLKHYNLDVIISVGYRVKSLIGTKFRIWATKRLNEYIVKGFTMNDNLLKKAGGGNYWNELLERIRDIRSSEKVFYRQVLDIYATSIDYDPRTEMSQLFFQTVQNKMHYAAHGHTAAEILILRADSSQPFMGLTFFENSKPRKSDVVIAKNYLNEEELKILNRIVAAYLEFAELQALRKKPMYMKDWIEKLNDFIKMSGSEFLENAGKISHLEATTKAMLEFEKYKEQTKDELSQIEKDFIDAIGSAEKKIVKKTENKIKP